MMGFKLITDRKIGDLLFKLNFDHYLTLIIIIYIYNRLDAKKVIIIIILKLGLILIIITAKVHISASVKTDSKHNRIAFKINI